MTDHINTASFCAMLTESASQLRAARETLSRLDAATGDGDHGTAMSKVADAIDTVCTSSDNNDLSAFFDTLGWAVMGTNSGSTGPLFGFFFIGMGEGITQSDLSPLDFAKALECGLTKLQGISKAQAGDKTLVDALIPAIQAIRASADAGDDFDTVLRAGAAAAQDGAKGTEGMRAKFGRARNLGERSIGHVDPGATSVALMFIGFERGFSDA